MSNPYLDFPVGGEESAMSDPTTITWTRLGDRLPDICEPILLAQWSELNQAWRVRDAKLYIRHEGVAPKVEDLAEGTAQWWFDSCYPGKGDMRLGWPDNLWAPMPSPAAPELEHGSVQSRHSPDRLSGNNPQTVILDGLDDDPPTVL